MAGDDGFIPFESIDHTADLAFIARGRSLAELFRNAACGMLSFLVDRQSVRDAEEEGVQIEGADLEELLVAWLQEILYQIEVRRRIYRTIDVSSIESGSAGWRLRASVRGEAQDPSRHTLCAHIKAATYHGLKIEKEEGPAGALYRARVVLDV